jgi:hypothetical protein
MRFIPSQPGFGTYGADDPASAEEEEKKSGLAQVEAFLPAVRSLLFGESARVDAAKLRGQIENLERKLDAGAGVLHNFYVDDLNKKRAKLAEVESMSEEEKSAAQKDQITRAAIAAGAVLGTLVIAGMVFNQVQKARLLEAQIHKAEG